MPVLIDLPDKEEFIRLYMSGVSETRLLLKYYVSRNTIYRWVEKLGISRRKIQKPILKKIRRKLVDKNELYELRVNKKWTYSELAQHFHVHRTTIRNRCKEYDFPDVSHDNSNHYWKKEFKLYKTR